MPAFKDHFSSTAARYARFRPRYPAALFSWLAGVAPAREAAWDCATGSGQAALGLAEHFARVVATDASAEQIAHAAPHPRVSYRVALADASGLEDGTMDLVTVAQALHWLDTDAFFAEARRVLRPGGVCAVWSYGNPTLEPPELQALLQGFHDATLAGHWPAERALLLEGYRGLELPFAPLAPPSLAMEAALTLEEFAGYLRTWSGVRAYVSARGEDPVAPLEEAMRPQWRDGERRVVRWPLHVRAGAR